MSQTETLVSLPAILSLSLRRLGHALAHRHALRLTIRLDREAPGAHLMWDIINAGRSPITLTKLIVHGRRGASSTVPLGLPLVLEPEDRLVLPIDVDWSLLAARSVAAADASGREHSASHRQLAAVQRQLRQLMDRRMSTTSAREFLFGAADLAFGVVILGLGFFLLMWVIATG